MNLLNAENCLVIGMLIVQNQTTGSCYQSLLIVNVSVETVYLYNLQMKLSLFL